MKLQNLTVIFIAIIIPIILLVSFYIGTGLKTINYQSLYDTGLLTATHDAIYAFELNTTNDLYSDNAETKRNILKSSVKAFEKGLANTCGIPAYKAEQIEEYIPAIVFGMYDGFYLYAPSYNSQTKKYEHDLKNYIYYSETLDDGTVISYSLDNHIMVSGMFNGKYEMKEGYLIDLNGTFQDGSKYKGISIDKEDADAIKYYKDAYYFTNWFLNTEKINQKKKDGQTVSYLTINNSNDPENENSAFVQHKRSIMKEKMESVLNSSITAYSKRIGGHSYKMPKFSEEDWQKIYSNISMTTFFQGKSIGLTKYNGYCVLNSTNSNEYVNSNLMYFTDENGTYHDIRCEKKSNQLKGFKIGSFGKRKVEVEKKDESGNVVKDSDGNIVMEYQYQYDHKEEACYYCVNGPLNTSQSIQEYLQNANSDIKSAYWTSVARERYNTSKLFDTQCIITTKLEGLTYTSDMGDIVRYGDSYTLTIKPENSLTHRRPKDIVVMMNGTKLTGGYTYNQVNGEITIAEVTGDVVINAKVLEDTSNISAKNAQVVSVGQTLTAPIEQKYQVRVFKFTPTQTANYKFWSDDKLSKTHKPSGGYEADPYAYLYDASKYTVDQIDEVILEYANSTLKQQSDVNKLFNNESKIKPEVLNDDGGEGFNFSMEYQCRAGNSYYLIVRTYSPDKEQSFTPIYIQRVP